MINLKFYRLYNQWKYVTLKDLTTCETSSPASSFGFYNGESLPSFKSLLADISRAQADSACLLRYDFKANVRSQRSHLNCLSGEWVCMCALRFERSANALLHSGHKKGRSPVCDLICPCRSQGRLKAFPHTLHLWRSLCVKTCIANAGMDT